MADKKSPSSAKYAKLFGKGTFYQRKDGYWVFQIYDTDEDDVYKRLSFTGKTEEKVAKKYKDFLKQVKEIRAKRQEQAILQLVSTSSNLKLPAGIDKDISLSDWVLYYIKTYKSPPSVKRTTYSSYMEIYRKHIEPFFGNTPLNTITDVDIQTFLTFLQTQGRLDKKGGLSSKTIYNYFVVLDAALEKARGKVIVDNPITGIHLPEVQPIDRRVLTPEEMEIFIKEILKERLRVVMFISLFTGIRLGEVLPLQWADVNEKKRTLWIHRDIERVLLFDDPSGRKTELIVQETPKSKSSHRRVPLPEEIFRMLMLHKKVQEYEKKPNPENLVFPSKRGTYTDPRTYQKRVNVVCKRCELQGVNVHALRHTFATRLMEQNVPIRIIQSLLGHASIVTTEKYSHALDEEKVKAVNRLSEYFPGED